MALDTNIPMQGQPLDTASPLMALAKTQMDQAQIASQRIDAASKANLYTMQVMSAGAAGGQQSYDAAKQHIASTIGPDAMAGWAPDYQTGINQAKALQTALIPPVAMMNAGIQQQRNDIQAAGVNGTNAPNGPVVPASTTQTTQPVQSTNGPTVPQILQQPLQPTGPQGNAPPALPAQQPTDGQQGDQQLQQHYTNASPEDQKTAQNIVSGAVQLQGMQNDPQAVQKFLDDPNNIHDQHNIDMRKLWMSDTSPDKQKFWQQNAVDIKTGQAMGIAPQQAAPSQAQGFKPSVGPANENPKAKSERVASELAVYNASPAAKQASSTATSYGTDTGKIKADAENAFNVMMSNIPAVVSRTNGIIKYAPDASSGLGVHSDGTESGLYPMIANSAMGSSDTAMANAQLSKLAAQGAFPEIASALKNSSMKGNRFLEQLMSNGLSINSQSPADVKAQQAQTNLSNYIQSVKSTAAQLRAQGNQNIPTDQQIDAVFVQNGATLPETFNGNQPSDNSGIREGATATNSMGHKIIFKGGKWQEK